MTLPLIEKVYSDEFKSSWDYALRFFDECAVNVVEIPAVRLAGATECAAAGHDRVGRTRQKAGGAKKDTVYTYFAKFPAESTHAVIDAVYAHDRAGPRRRRSSHAWNACMAPLTRGE